MFILDTLALRTKSKPNEPAIIHDEWQITFDGLRALVLAAAARLREHGLPQGRTVAIYVNDPVLHLVLILALMREAVPSFSGHTNYDPPPEGLEPGACIADRALDHMEGVPTILVDRTWLSARLPAGGAPERRRFAGEEALVRVFASSGTTGRPKAIPVTGAMLRERIVGHIMAGIYHGGRLVPVASPAASFGFRPRMVALMMGQTLVFAEGAPAIAAAIDRYAVNEIRLSVAQLQALLDWVARAPQRLASLRHIVTGGSPVPPAMVATARARLGCEIASIYGSTETGTMAVAPGRALELYPGCAGFVMPGVAVEIVDEEGRPLPHGREGIVRVRTPGMFGGYLGDPPVNATAFRHGWFHPGDTGVLRADGLLTVIGRTSHLINAGGVKTSPELINEFLLAQPGIAEAAAFGVDHPDRATEIWAAVVATGPFDETALVEAARRRLTSRAPVRIVRLDRLPRNAMGKVLVDALRREATGRA